MRWLPHARDLTRRPLDRDRRCGVLVVGAGITGALMAQHLASLGHGVCVIDRERPGLGSTAARTAMLLWEIDKKLTTLTAIYGFEHAARVYRQSLAAVAGPMAMAATASPFRYLASRLIATIGAGRHKAEYDDHSLERPLPELPE